LTEYIFQAIAQLRSANNTTVDGTRDGGCTRGEKNDLPGAGVSRVAIMTRLERSFSAEYNNSDDNLSAAVN